MYPTRYVYNNNSSKIKEYNQIPYHISPKVICIVVCF